MSFFFTENRIEGLLERETRSLPGPGCTVSITAFKAFWKAYDFLVFSGIHSADRLTDLAQRNSELLGISFGESLAAIVWSSNADARRILGFDCFAIRSNV